MQGRASPFFNAIAKARILFAALVVVSLIGACASTEGSQGGQLLVNVIAPEGVTPRLVLKGPDESTRIITKTTLLSGLAEGAYVLLPESATSNGETYVPVPPQWRGEVFEVAEDAPGEQQSVTVVYMEGVQPSPGPGPDPEPAPAPVRPGASTYHLDCVSGDDGGVGLGPESAWRSLGRLSGLVLQPGDRVLLRRGCAWEGPLRIPWEGSSEWPVVVGAYGEGPLPAIHDSSLNHVDISGSHLVVEHLQAFTSPGSVPVDARCEDQPVAWRTGFTLQHGAHHVTIRHSLAYGNTAGIHVTRGASHNRLVNNELRDNVIMSVNTDNGGQDDSGAWGLVLNGTDNVVAYNRFSGNNAWCSYDFGQEGASIEVYEAQRNLIHHNVSIGDTTFAELGSSDYRDAADNVFAYNVYVSHRRNSEFLVLRGAGAHFGPTPGTKAFHNTVYLTHPEETQGVVCYSGCGPHILELRNNIIWAEWKGIYVDQPIAESHNLFWRSNGRPLLQFFGDGNAMSSDSIIANPLFRNPDENDFRLQNDSPALFSGVVTSTNRLFDRDATGVLIDPLDVPDMGAHRAD